MHGFAVLEESVKPTAAVLARAPLAGGVLCHRVQVLKRLPDFFGHDILRRREARLEGLVQDRSSLRALKRRRSDTRSCS